MIIINIAAVVIAIAVVALVISLIPLIKELKTTTVAVREIAGRMETNIQPTLKELQDALADVNVLTAVAAEKVEDIECLMTAIGDTGKGLRTISTVVGGAAGAVAKSSLWLTGAKVAGSYMLERFTKKRR